MQALYRGDDETARRLAETAKLDVFEAASLGRAERLRELLAADPALAQARSEDDFTALHYAAFFDGPRPTPASSPSITAAEVNVRLWGGPSAFRSV